MGKETISLCAGAIVPVAFGEPSTFAEHIPFDPQCSIWVPYHVGCVALPQGRGWAEVFLLGFVLFFKLGSWLEKFNG